MNWFKAFDKEILLSRDFIKAITINGKKFCAVKCDKELFITQAYCPHAGADLSGGWCENGKLICPFHRYTYDLQTGKGALGQGDYIDVYPVEQREDGIYVGIPEGFNLFKWFLKFR